MVEAPKVPPQHPDRGLHAEEAIAVSFDALAADAERKGWTPDEAAFALLSLAVARVLALDANQETDEAIARAVRSVHGDVMTVRPH